MKRHNLALALVLTAGIAGAAEENATDHSAPGAVPVISAERNASIAMPDEAAQSAQHQEMAAGVKEVKSGSESKATPSNLPAKAAAQESESAVQKAEQAEASARTAETAAVQPAQAETPARTAETAAAQPAQAEAPARTAETAAAQPAQAEAQVRTAETAAAQSAQAETPVRTAETAAAQPAQAEAPARTAETAAAQPAQAEAPASTAETAAAQPATEKQMTSPENSAESRMFTPEQEARIGQIAKAYLLAHPEVLMEAGEKLDALQHEKQIERITAAVIEHQDALLNDKAIPTAGPAEAKVVVIEFFDYQCIVCARQAPIVNSLMQAHPEVRYIFMEWPIFASRWETSLTAAETGLMVWQQKGAEAYLAYHHALFATGHQEGKLTQADIKKAAGKLKGKAQTMLDVIA